MSRGDPWWRSHWGEPVDPDSITDPGLRLWIEAGRNLPTTRRPPGAYYPIAAPDLRERNPEMDRLLVGIMEAFRVRDVPPIVTERDKVRLRVFLWRFLYSPEWPGGNPDDEPDFS